MTQPPTLLDRGPTLLAIARGAVAERLGLVAPPCAAARWLEEPGATFVTLHRQGQLRGCVGTLSPNRPLGEDVAANAREAAFRDTRFPPLARSEYADTGFEVSLLSPLEPLRFESRAQLLGLLRPHEDGLVLSWDGHRGAFLPQVWEQLPDPADFLAHLNQKAGLAPAAWNDEMRLSRFTVTRFQEGVGVGSPG